MLPQGHALHLRRGAEPVSEELDSGHLCGPLRAGHRAAGHPGECGGRGHGQESHSAVCEALRE